MVKQTQQKSNTRKSKILALFNQLEIRNVLVSNDSSITVNNHLLLMIHLSLLPK